MNLLTRNKSLITMLGITSAAMLGGFAGCSSTSTGDDSSTNTDSGTAGDGSPGNDGAPQGDGGTGDSGGPTTISTGTVVFTQTAITAVYSDSSFAAFYVLPAGTDLDCAGYGTIATPAATSASCSIKLCTNPISTDAGVIDAGVSDAGPTTSPNTGNITLLSTVDTGGVIITAGSNGTYTGATAVTQWWAAGDTAIEVKSAGSATSIAAFDDTALVGPGDVTGPMFNSTAIGGEVPATVAFDRGTDLTVAYSGGTASTNVYVMLSTTSSTQKSLISCSFDAANGAESIKTADLENLEKANGAAITGAYTLQGRSTKATTAGDFNFNVVLNANAHSGTFTNSN